MLNSILLAKAIRRTPVGIMARARAATIDRPRGSCLRRRLHTGLVQRFHHFTKGDGHAPAALLHPQTEGPRRSPGDPGQHANAATIREGAAAGAAVLVFKHLYIR